MFQSVLVSFPDLIRRVYRLQYNARAILKAIRAWVGFGSGTETKSVCVCIVYVNSPVPGSPLRRRDQDCGYLVNDLLLCVSACMW